MSEGQTTTSWWTPIRVGLLLSFLIAIAFVFLAITEVCRFLPTQVLECRWNYAWFLDSTPNEIGDTLSGFAGSLAFIWIVVTVWLQSTELAEQRKVMREQKEEFKLMVAAQDAQVLALREQAAVLKLDQLQRSEDRAEQELNALLTSTRRLIEENANNDKFMTWLTDSGRYVRRLGSMGNAIGQYSKYDSVSSDDDYAIKLNGLIQKQMSLAIDGDEDSRKRGYSPLDELETQGVERLRDLIHRALLLEERLSSAQRYRLKSLRLSSTLALLDQALSDPSALLEVPTSTVDEV